jgi:hypothetical protein
MGAKVSASLAPAYLYSEPYYGRRHFGIIHTGDGWFPEWWRTREKRDIRIAPLTEEDLRHPLIDIIRAHVRELEDPS